MSLFGGESSQSNSVSDGIVSLNSSGWAVGTSKAQGGDISTSSGIALPWYAWASFAVIGLALYRKMKGK